MTNPEYKSHLHEMTQTTATALWNDSCSIQELSNSIATNGAVGATCNPVIVLSVLKKEWNLWKDRLPEIVNELPKASDEEVTWRLVEEMSQKAAALLMPIRNFIAMPDPSWNRPSTSPVWLRI
jgi:transaldolase